MRNEKKERAGKTRSGQRILSKLLREKLRKRILLREFRRRLSSGLGQDLYLMGEGRRYCRGEQV